MSRAGLFLAFADKKNKKGEVNVEIATSFFPRNGFSADLCLAVWMCLYRKHTRFGCHGEAASFSKSL
jgi:hypothetical protein